MKRSIYLEICLLPLLYMILKKEEVVSLRLAAEIQPYNRYHADVIGHEVLYFVLSAMFIEVVLKNKLICDCVKYESMACFKRVQACSI